MSKNNTLNPMVEELIRKNLEIVERLLGNEDSYVQNLEADHEIAKDKIVKLRNRKSTYETILKSGDATYAEPFLYESPKEFKVRE